MNFIDLRETKNQIDYSLFKYRFFIENSNGFWQLFRTEIRSKNNLWTESNKPDILLCNYIHTEYKNNKIFKSMPANRDNPIEV